MSALHESNVDAELVVAEYFDSLADDDRWSRFSDREAAVLDGLMAEWNIQPGMFVLEPGCGAGRFTTRLASRLGDQGLVFACDISPAFIDRAAAAELPDNVRLWCGSVCELPIADEEVDTAICLAAFPHFANVAGALDEIHRVLRPGGTLHIAHLTSREQINRIHEQAGPPLSNHLLPEGFVLQRLLRRHGFRLDKLEDAPTHYWCRAIKD